MDIFFVGGALLVNKSFWSSGRRGNQIWVEKYVDIEKWRLNEGNS